MKYAPAIIFMRDQAHTYAARVRRKEINESAISALLEADARQIADCADDEMRLREHGWHYYMEAAPTIDASLPLTERGGGK